MGKVIGVYNRKGGVGKTTCCFNIAAQMAKNGKKVLLLDGDSQTNMTLMIYRGNDSIFDERAKIRDDVITIADILKEESPVEDAIRELTFEHEWSKMVRSGKKMIRKTFSAECSFDFVPGSKDLVYYSNDNLDSLQKALNPVRDEYDYIFVEFPPSFDLATLTYLIACDYVAVPLRILEEASTDGYNDLLDRIQEAHEAGSSVEILGLFYNFVHNNWKSHTEWCEMSVDPAYQEEGTFFKTHIRQIDSTVQYSTLLQKPLCICAAEEPITKDFENLCKEIEERVYG